MKKSHHKENYHYNPVHTNLNANENRKNAVQKYIIYIQKIQKNPYIFLKYLNLKFKNINTVISKTFFDKLLTKQQKQQKI